MHAIVHFLKHYYRACRRSSGGVVFENDNKKNNTAMNTVLQLFGEGKELTIFQMCNRGVVVFIVALILIRVSGRRSFGQHTALDNIISILLGAVLSRAVAGASPFFPVIACSFVVVMLHRVLCWLAIRNTFINSLLKGDKIVLFENGKLRKENLKKALVSEEDIMQGIRTSALTDKLEKVEKIYMESNGEVSVIEKQ